MYSIDFISPYKKNINNIENAVRSYVSFDPEIVIDIRHP